MSHKTYVCPVEHNKPVVPEWRQPPMHHQTPPVQVPICPNGCGEVEEA